MLYGRRQINSKRSSTSSKQENIWGYALQSKYTWMVVIGTLLGISFFVLPLFYFTHQNYDLFVRLAYDVEPKLVDNIERETHFLYFFLVVSIVSICFSTTYLTVKLIRKFIKPMNQLEFHLQKMIRGEWKKSLQFIPGNESDNFEFLGTYDYFIRSLNTTVEHELKLLEKLQIDPSNREAHLAWKNLINNKRALLGIEPLTTDFEEVKVEPVKLRRVA